MSNEEFVIDIIRRIIEQEYNCYTNVYKATDHYGIEIKNENYVSSNRILVVYIKFKDLEDIGNNFYINDFGRLMHNTFVNINKEIISSFKRRNIKCL